jgi:hypothetical protein
MAKKAKKSVPKRSLRDYGRPSHRPPPARRDDDDDDNGDDGGASASADKPGKRRGGA